MPDPRLSILRTPFDPHGGPDGSGQTLLDFSVNSNPFGPPAALLAELASVDVASYPDPTYQEARARAALYHHVAPACVTFGNGTAELIYRLAACYLQPGTKALVATPTFGEYARASRLNGASVVAVEVYTDWPSPDEAALIAAIARERPTLVWLCHPNNPSGHAWHPDQLAEVARACLEHDALLAIDAAYLALSEVTETHLTESAVRLYSLTKVFGVPGVRAGYALAEEAVSQVLQRAAPPWQLSAHAEAAARWALTEEGEAFRRATVPSVLALRRALQAKLRALGYPVTESCTGFFLLQVADAAAFKAQAAAAGFRVRDCTSFGLQRHVRLAAQRPEANAALLSWLGSKPSIIAP